MGKRILVCGGRTYGFRINQQTGKEETIFEDVDFLFKALDALYEKYKSLHIINGAAKGADKWSSLWAEDYMAFGANVTLSNYPADWKKHRKAAGFIRNKQMLDEGKPDLVLAFPGDKGTKMMCEIAEKAGVKVIKLDPCKRSDNDVTTYIS